MTISDQDKIDATLARACAAGAYARSLCAMHTRVSAEQRKALASPGLPTS